MAKANPAGGKEYGSQTGGYQSSEPDPAETRSEDQSPDASAASLDDKQRQLLKLQVDEKALAAEIARLRAFQAEQAGFVAQVKAAAALDSDVAELKTFVTAEKKAFPPGTDAKVNAARTVVDTAIGTAATSHATAAADLEKKTVAVQNANRAVAEAAEKYATEKQAVSERKRILGELKNLRKAVQDAHGRSDFEAAAFWLLELELRLDHIPTPDPAKAITAWDALEQKRKELDELTGAVEIAKAEEAEKKKAVEALRKTRETDILAGLHPTAATSTHNPAA